MSSHVLKKKAILIEAVFNRTEGDHLAELAELAYVSGYEVVGRIVQNLERPTSEYLFGSGKVKEIKGLIKELQADVVIIENKLDTIQYNNLRSTWHIEIIDRFELILEIFINRAGTQEAITQIRLAALKKEGGSRIDSHQTTISRGALIKKLEKKLELIRKSKDNRRKRRIQSGFDLVAIAGYTNSGKSTLMNCLTKADVEVSGRMFTTLNTITRSLDALGRKVLVTDTVGLISRLPHILIEAFYATLKEINEADLILLLIDASESLENIKKKLMATLNTLAAIAADKIPTLPVLNKIDITHKIDEKIEFISIFTKKTPVIISAKNQINIALLKSEIINILDTYKFHVKIPNTDEGLSLLSNIHNKTRLTEELFHQTFIEIKFETNERLAQYLYNILVKDKSGIEIINKEDLEKHLLKKGEEVQDDQFTIIKTEEGEEFIVFDLSEDDKTSSITKTHEPHNDLGLKTNLNETKKKDGKFEKLS